jgi:Uma2 family endonuclease
MSAIAINLNSITKLTDEQFERLCGDNPDVRLERNARGELIAMPPTGGETGKRNANLTFQFYLWNQQNKLGEVFDSSTGYLLSNSAIRSPDVSWIKQERWDALTLQQKEKYIPIPPDFVLELISPSDTLTEIRGKMQEYMENQVRLGWLINPKTQQVEIYRVRQEIEIIQSPLTLSGEDVLPSFVLNLQTVWQKT